MATIGGIGSGTDWSSVMATRAGNAQRPQGGQRPDAAQMTERFMNDFDTDGNGTVESGELSTLLQSAGVENAEDVAGSVIEKMGGSDGTLSQEQIQSSFEAREKEMESRIKSAGIQQQVLQFMTDQGTASDEDTSALSSVDGSMPPPPPPPGGRRGGSGEDTSSATQQALSQYQSIQSSGTDQRVQMLLRMAA